MEFTVGQIVKMKKPHPCGENRWMIIRIGMDFRIKCMNCGRSVMIPRRKFELRVREILGAEEPPSI